MSYSLLHPDKLVFFDEVGEKITQKSDRNAGRQKFKFVRDMRAQVCNSFKYNQFTVLGFMSANGRPIMCSIIIATSTFKLMDVTGFTPCLRMQMM
jgi:hypothetical protein